MAVTAYSNNLDSAFSVFSSKYERLLVNNNYMYIAPICLCSATLCNCSILYLFCFIYMCAIWAQAWNDILGLGWHGTTHRFSRAIIGLRMAWNDTDFPVQLSGLGWYGTIHNFPRVIIAPKYLSNNALKKRFHLTHTHYFFLSGEWIRM